MSEIVRGLSDAERRRIARLRSAGRFFWADIALADASAEDLSDALDLPMHALEPLLTFGHGGSPSLRFHADGDHVVFPFHCYLTDHEEMEEEAGTSYEVIEVNVLVHGDFLLTVHRERVPLPQILPAYSTEGRSEQYVVYAVLDGMLATAFDALNATELALEGLQVLAGETRNAKVRSGTLRAITVRLTTLRRRLGGSSGSRRRSAR